MKCHQQPDTFVSESRLRSDLRYTQYDYLVEQYSRAKEEFLRLHPDPADQFFQTHLATPTGKVLVDGGCGTGDEALAYERMGFAAVFGIDPSRKMIEEAKKKVASPGNFRLGTFEQTGFLDNSVDIVFGQYSFHYTEDLDTAYQEVARILRPGGLLALAVRHPISDMSETIRFKENGRNYVTPMVYGRVPIKHPMHAFQEYFSLRFLSLFDLVEWQEWNRPDISDEQVSPFLFGFAARRRGV